MRRILLSCALLAVLALPAAATARAAKPGYLVVRKGVGDGGANGSPVATVVVKGFLLGRVSQEARVAVYQLPSAAGQGGPQAKGADLSRRSVRWRTRGHVFKGTEYRGSNFRFSAIGGYYRVVVRGSGVYLFAGGRGHVTLQGSAVYRHADGRYSVNGGVFRSLPESPVQRKIGRG